MSAQPIPFLWTNDDLSSADYTNIGPIVQMLDKHGIKGTFFVIPCQAAEHFMTDKPDFVAHFKKCSVPVTNAISIAQHISAQKTAPPTCAGST